MTDDAAPPATSNRRHILRLAVFAAFLIGLWVLIGVTKIIDVDDIRGVIAATGWAAPLTYVVVSALLGAIFVPGPILAAGSGVLFGPVLGTFVTLGATVGTATIASLAGRRADRDSARALLGPDRADRIDAQIDRRGLWASVERFVPGISDALASYAFGAFGVPLWQMALGAFIGSVPRAFVYTALGASIGDLSAPLAYTAIAVWCVTAVIGAYAAHRGYQSWRGRARNRDDATQRDEGTPDVSYRRTMTALEFSASIVVSVEPDELYDIVSDVTRTGEWSPVCRACWWDEGPGYRRTPGGRRLHRTQRDPGEDVGDAQRGRRRRSRSRIRVGGQRRLRAVDHPRAGPLRHAAHRIVDVHADGRW